MNFNEDYRFRKTPILVAAAVLSASVASNIISDANAETVYIRSISSDLCTADFSSIEPIHLATELVSNVEDCEIRDLLDMGTADTYDFITLSYLPSNNSTPVTAEAIIEDSSLSVDTDIVEFLSDTSATEPAEMTYKPTDEDTKALFSMGSAYKHGIHFNPYDVTEPSHMTREQVEYFVNLRCPAFVGMEDYLLSLDDKLNLLFILTVARAETGAGEACVGDYNCFNIRVASGAYKDYYSYQQSVDDFVDLILNQYINPEGMWHEGTSVEAIGIHYAESPWAGGILTLADDILWVIDRDLSN